MRSVIATAHSSPIVQRLHALVGAHEAAQRLGIEAAVGVRDERPGEAEDARIARRAARRRASAARGRSRGGRSSRISRICSSTMWKLSTSHSAAGVIGALLADRLGDARGTLRAARGRCRAARGASGRAVPRVGGDALRGGEALGVLLEALDAEELGADRLLRLRRRRQRGPFPVDEPENTSASHAPGTGADRRGGPLVAMGLDIARRGSSRKPRRRRQV